MCRCPRTIGIALGLVAIVAIATTVGVVASGGSHGNHLAVDPQVSQEGTVLVETMFSLDSSFVVLKTTEDGHPGEPLGHTAVAGGAVRTDVAVPIDDARWSDWTPGTNRTLWAVLHADADGDGTFDPATDPPLTTRNPAARTRFVLRKHDDGSVRVLAATVSAQRLTGSTLTIRRVDLAHPGFVVISAPRSERVLGHRWLPPGRHENVSVPVAADDNLPDSSRFRLRVTAYYDDGNDAFDDGDEPVTVADRPVETIVLVERGDGTDEPLINTPIGTPIPSETPTLTPTVRATEPTNTMSTPTTEPTDRRATTRSSATSTGASGTGFGVATPVLAVVLAAMVARRRHQPR